MKIIKCFILFRYLVKNEGLDVFAAMRNVDRARKLPSDLQAAVYNILDNIRPDIEVEGVTYDSLVEEDDMTSFRAILFLDWLRREPEMAMEYMANEIHHDADAPELAVGIDENEYQQKENELKNNHIEIPD